jgi:hypothetical protein
MRPRGARIGLDAEIFARRRVGAFRRGETLRALRINPSAGHYKHRDCRIVRHANNHREPARRKLAIDGRIFLHRFGLSLRHFATPICGKRQSLSHETDSSLNFRTVQVFICVAHIRARIPPRMIGRYARMRLSLAYARHCR